MFGDHCNDVNTLDLDIRSAIISPELPQASLPNVDVSLAFEGPFTLDNVDTSSLNCAILQRFSANLRAKYGDSVLISTAVLIGSLLHVLCSTAEIKSQIRTFRNGSPAANVFTEENLSLDLRRLLATKIGKSIDTVMHTFRTTSQVENYYSLCAYAAAAILHFEVDYFVRSLESGPLSSRVSKHQ